MASSSSRFGMPFLCILAIFACFALLADARNPVEEPPDQPFPTTVQPQQSNGQKHEFGEPNSYNQVLRLPSQKDDSISMEDRPKWQQPRFPVLGRPFIMPLHERDLIFKRFSFASRLPFRFGRHGGCDHSKRKHFLIRRGDYGRRYFPGNKGPDSITLDLDFDGEPSTFHVFPIQSESAGFRPEHGFGPADLEESKPHDSVVMNDEVPEEHVHWVFPREAARRSHEEQEEGPAGRWIGWLKSLFHRP